MTKSIKHASQRVVETVCRVALFGILGFTLGSQR